MSADARGHRQRCHCQGQHDPSHLYPGHGYNLANRSPLPQWPRHQSLLERGSIKAPESRIATPIRPLLRTRPTAARLSRQARRGGLRCSALVQSHQLWIHANVLQMQRVTIGHVIFQRVLECKALGACVQDQRFVTTTDAIAGIGHVDRVVGAAARSANDTSTSSMGPPWQYSSSPNYGPCMRPESLARMGWQLVRQLRRVEIGPAADIHQPQPGIRVKYVTSHRQVQVAVRFGWRLGCQSGISKAA